MGYDDIKDASRVATDADHVQAIEQFAKRVFDALNFPAGTWEPAPIELHAVGHRTIEGAPNMARESGGGAWGQYWIHVNGRQVHIKFEAWHRRGDQFDFRVDKHRFAPSGDFEAFREKVDGLIKDKVARHNR